MNEHANGHAQLTEVLLANEVIYTEDVEKIFGARRWKSRSEEILRDNEEIKERQRTETELPIEDPIPQTINNEENNPHENKDTGAQMRFMTYNKKIGNTVIGVAYSFIIRYMFLFAGKRRGLYHLKYEKNHLATFDYISLGLLFYCILPTSIFE